MCSGETRSTCQRSRWGKDTEVGVGGWAAAGRQAREGFGRGAGGEERAEEGGVDGEAEEERVAEQAGQRGGGGAEAERLRGGGVCADGLNAATRGENFFGPGFRYGARHSAP